MEEIVVIGCGVIGLTTAVRLAESGFKTRIVTKSLPVGTTSSKAAAIWFPYKAEPPEKIRPWARTSYHYYGYLSSMEGQAKTGVRFVDLQTLSRHAEPDLFWLEDEYPFRWLRGDEVPTGVAHAFSVVVPLIESAPFLKFLLERFLDLGGTLVEQEVEDLAEPALAAKVVVNCTGLGSKALVAAHNLYPIRGQIVRVRSDQDLQCLADDSDEQQPFYVIPRSEDCILGGTAEAEVADETPSPATAEKILEECQKLEPGLVDCEVLETYVGVRPGRRGGVRLGAETLDNGRTVIHNFGHGGSGFTLCWGCAEEVLALVRTMG